MVLQLTLIRLHSFAHTHSLTFIRSYSFAHTHLLILIRLHSFAHTHLLTLICLHSMSRFGINGFQQPALPTDRSKLSLVQMAQRGFYYAEEYRGEFGAPPADPNVPRVCTPASGWRCFAVGVRTFDNKENPSSNTPSGGDSWYQPLPTPGYNVDLQVAAAIDVAVTVNGSASAAVDPCTTLGEIYIQHVNGFGKPVGNFRPIMEFNGSQPRTISLCPANSTTIGCATGQTQTAAGYIASLRAECTRIRKDEEYNAGYKVRELIACSDSRLHPSVSYPHATHTHKTGSLHPHPAVDLDCRPFHGSHHAHDHHHARGSQASCSAEGEALR
jgi:hypothetical protein